MSEYGGTLECVNQNFREQTEMYHHKLIEKWSTLWEQHSMGQGIKALNKRDYPDAERSEHILKTAVVNMLKFSQAIRSDMISYRF
jgi:hypothetical protein